MRLFTFSVCPLFSLFCSVLFCSVLYGVCRAFCLCCCSCAIRKKMQGKNVAESGKSLNVGPNGYASYWVMLDATDKTIAVGEGACCFCYCSVLCCTLW